MLLLQYFDQVVMNFWKGLVSVLMQLPALVTHQHCQNCHSNSLRHSEYVSIFTFGSLKFQTFFHSAYAITQIRMLKIKNKKSYSTPVCMLVPLIVKTILVSVNMVCAIRVETSL